MPSGVRRIRHVKLPVTDLRRSTAWYRALLDLDLAGEFAEGGSVRGVQLMDPDGGFGIALRVREFCVGEPVLSGFDPVAFEVESIETLHHLAERFDDLDIAHTGVADRGRYGAFLDVPDPDGIVLRFLANNPFRQGRFVGVDLDEHNEPILYEAPTLDA